MSRFERRFQGRRPHRRFQGPRRVRPNRPHFRDFRKEALHAQQREPPPKPQVAETIPVAQARGPGHSRIMGQIEHDVRTLLKIIEIPPEQTVFYLALAREMYSDYENCKSDTVQAALDITTARWIAREFKPEIVKRIRTRVTDVYNSLKSQRTPIRSPPSQPNPEPNA